MRQPHNITVRLDDPNNYRIVDYVIVYMVNVILKVNVYVHITGIECKKACKLYKGQMAGHGDCNKMNYFYI